MCHLFYILLFGTVISFVYYTICKNYSYSALFLDFDIHFFI